MINAIKKRSGMFSRCEDCDVQVIETRRFSRSRGRHHYRLAPRILQQNLPATDLALATGR
jgi:hypothetical protein